jgi:hypothetical protein
MLLALSLELGYPLDAAYSYRAFQFICWRLASAQRVLHRSNNGIGHQNCGDTGNLRPIMGSKGEVFTQLLPKLAFHPRRKDSVCTRS